MFPDQDDLIWTGRDLIKVLSEYCWRFLGQEGSCCSRIIPGIDTYAWLEA